jgi:hypothetical protein
MPGNTGVMNGVLGISVTKVILHRPQISALVGQVVAAGVAEHVRPDAPELCGLSSDPHDKIDGLPGELCLPLGHEQPGQIVLPGGEVALDGAEFVAGDRVLDAQAALEASPRPASGRQQPRRRQSLPSSQLMTLKRASVLPGDIGAEPLYPATARNL